MHYKYQQNILLDYLAPCWAFILKPDNSFLYQTRILEWENETQSSYNHLIKSINKLFNISKLMILNIPKNIKV